MNEEISVIICTYNPQEVFFKQCLDYIDAANKSFKVKEILIIDNNSAPALDEVQYVTNFAERNSNTRIIKEIKKGLTPARLRGIKESTGGLLVFIDDDNFIGEDFFEEGNKIANQNPHIGAWSGQVKLVFEQEPEPSLNSYLGLLVKKDLDKDVWSNFPHLPETMPCGAGLFVRRNAAKYYLQLHRDGKRDIQLDRAGDSLFSGGDNDLAACACDIGLGVGLFYTLIVRHYIPAKRVTKEYLLRLAEGIAASTVVFKSFRGELPAPLTAKNKMANYLRLMTKTEVDKEFYKAVLTGTQKGRELIKIN